jgi:TldD protein
MKDIAEGALGATVARGVSYADVRVVETRTRHVSTKNGKIGHISSSESLGAGIRVLMDGCWGFAATDDVSGKGLAAAGALARDIARASAAAKKKDVNLAPEGKYEASWTSPCRIDPFGITVDQNLSLLLRIDEELRRVAGITLAEASMAFTRERQFFASSAGSRIEQTRTTSGAGFSALSYKGNEIQKRSYPNSFGGQYQLKGYELIHFTSSTGVSRKRLRP